MNTMVCRRPDCDRALVSHRIPVAQRPPGTYAHEGRGLCRRCYYRAGRVGVDGDWIPAIRCRDDVMAEWEFLRPTGITRREFASRMGMSWVAFDRMWWRARAAGDPRAVMA